ESELDLEALTLAFGDLEITVRRRQRPTAEPGSASASAAGPASGSEEFEATILAATTPEALSALELPQLAVLARRLTGAAGVWDGRARVARAFRAGLGARLHLAGGSKISSPVVPGLRNVYYIVLRAPGLEDGLWTRTLRTYREAVRTPGGALGTRAIARDEVEALAVSVHGDRPLPPLYFVIPAGADEEGDRFAVTYLLRVRANGFMVVLPDLARVREYVESLLNDDGDPAALVHRDQIQAETVRGRQLGPAHTLLVDLPWQCTELFLKTQALRGLQDRASRVFPLTVGTTPGRPMSGDALDAANRWLDRLDPDTAQEYWASAQEPEEEELEPEAPEAEPIEPGPAASRALPRAARASRAPARTTGALFGGARGLDGGDLDRLRTLAGGAPARVGTVERQTPGAGAGNDLFAEAELEALPPPDVEDPVLEQGQSSTSMQALLLAQMRQNAVLLEKLVSGQRTGDGVQDALASGLGSGGDSSGGIKGHLAREAFIRQMMDSKTVAQRVQANALTELGLSQPEPGLMREYIEKRVPLADQKLLQHFAALAAHGWELGFRSGNTELLAFTSRLLLFVEQSALDFGKVQLGYLLTGFADPPPLGFASRKAPGLKSFSRLIPPQWLAANLAYLKDLDYAETRIAQLTRGSQPLRPPTGDTAASPGDETEKPERPRRPPRRPKNADAS
ncbi:unnamed protein product, partial [Symbiodinium sp. KB8]